MSYSPCGPKEPDMTERLKLRVWNPQTPPPEILVSICRLAYELLCDLDWPLSSL